MTAVIDLSQSNECGSVPNTKNVVIGWRLISLASSATSPLAAMSATSLEVFAALLTAVDLGQFW
ncbi:hypothetical protein [Paraburkholderia caffeinilytica]|uniref:hypothetical protein n=1 Tax=Paraburkholderia caffeinilytica TaxID=1761016 RepID=UPI003DA12D00